MDDSKLILLFLLLYALLINVAIVLSKMLHDRPALGSIIPEAGMIISVGMAAGFLVRVFSSREPVVDSLLSFSSDVFFVALLPPIIFNSGYHLRRELFYRHFSPICMFAVLGTAISAVTIAGILYAVTKIGGIQGGFQPTLAELLTFGALISATDPVSTLAVFQVKRVDPQLFYLVFGESVLNDAVGLVLFQEFSKLLVPESEQKTPLELVKSFTLSFLWSSIGSPLLGVVFGVALALLFKIIDMRQNILLELSLYVFVLHVPYLLGEIFGLSGIVVILFTGITAKTYVVPNLSELTAMHSDFLFRLLAFLAETVIFLELGLSVFGLTGSFHLPFTAWALLACLIGRAFNVYPITWFHNWTIRRRSGVDRQHSDDIRDRPAQVMASKHKTEASSLLENGRPDFFSGKLSSKSLKKMLYMSERTPLERGDLKILPNCAHMLWFSGLRGAVAYACVRTFPNIHQHRDTFVMTTMMIVLVTVFMLGATTATILSILDIETDVSEDEYMNSWNSVRGMSGFIVKIEDFLTKHVIRKREIEVDADDDEVFITDSEDITKKNSFALDNQISRDSSMSERKVRFSSVTVTESFRWEGQGMYDFGMD